MIGGGLGKLVVALHLPFLDLARPIDWVSYRLSPFLPLCHDGGIVGDATG